MSHQTGNLSTTERAISAFAGLALSLLCVRRGNLAIRIAAGTASAALWARAYAGHCAVKSAIAGHTSLTEGIKDQWDRMSHKPSTALRGSPAYTARSSAIDESVEQSFPASDAPASRIPDVPPVNADAKWAAVRAARSAEQADHSRNTAEDRRDTD